MECKPADYAGSMRARLQTRLGRWHIVCAVVTLLGSRSVLAWYGATRHICRVSRLTVACTILLTWGVAVPAQADVRTASQANRLPAPQYSDSTHPQLSDAQVRLDTDAGRVDVTVNFVDRVADPATTRALRAWRIHVLIGDWMGYGDCEGAPETLLSIDATLGDDRPGVLDRFVDGTGAESGFPDTPVAKTVGADRSTVTLSATTPALVGMNLICAEVEVADRTHGESSRTYAMIFDGYSVVDGGFQREATEHLDDQVNELDYSWYDTRPESFAPPGSRCDPPTGETIVCRVPAARLRDVPGRPILTLDGVLRVDAKRMKHSDPRDGILWSYAVRGRVTWRRCPSFGGTTPRRLRGRPCHLNIRWNGREALFQARLHDKRLRG